MNVTSKYRLVSSERCTIVMRLPVLDEMVCKQLAEIYRRDSRFYEALLNPFALILIDPRYISRPSGSSSNTGWCKMLKTMEA